MSTIHISNKQEIYFFFFFTSCTLCLFNLVSYIMTTLPLLWCNYLRNLFYPLFDDWRPTVIFKPIYITYSFYSFLRNILKRFFDVTSFTNIMFHCCAPKAYLGLYRGYILVYFRTGHIYGAINVPHFRWHVLRSSQQFQAGFEGDVSSVTAELRRR